MSSPSSSTLPVIQPPSESSCIRFRQRRNVVLPHPDGPINAVTVCRGNMSDTSFTTARRPYSAVSRAVSSWSRASAGGAMTLPNRPAGGEGEEQHESHQHERDRKSTRLNSSHTVISYAVFCLKKKKTSSNLVDTRT